jgi:hypothetical protein
MGSLNGCEAGDKSQDLGVREEAGGIYVEGGEDISKESSKGQRTSKRVAGTHILMSISRC